MATHTCFVPAVLPRFCRANGSEAGSFSLSDLISLLSQILIFHFPYPCPTVSQKPISTYGARRATSRPCLGRASQLMAPRQAPSISAPGSVLHKLTAMCDHARCFSLVFTVSPWVPVSIALSVLK
ncbi:unnamed protein product, partial [Ectocarpus sp. 13 AM-2016]